MQIIIEKDGDGFLAKVLGTDELYAFGFTQKEAIRELSDVIEMVSDTFLPGNTENALKHNLSFA